MVNGQAHVGHRHSGGRVADIIVIDRFTNATIAAGMVIAAAPDSQETITGLNTKLADAGDGTIRHINLGDAFSSGEEGNLIDLTAEHGAVEFYVTPAFLASLSKGNRVLLRLRDPEQIPPITLLAFEHHLQLNFSRAGDSINIILSSSLPVAVPLPTGDDSGL